MKKNILALMIISYLFAGCSLIMPNKGTSTDLAKTNWNYADKDWKYQIKFKKNGTLKTTHPHSLKTDKDTWQQSGKTVKFYFNDKYSNYEGQITAHDTIIGKGQNKLATWDFKMYRVK